MDFIRVVICVLIFCGTAVITLAQPAPVQQIQNTRLTQQAALPPTLAGSTNAPELYQGENVDVGPQHILRLAPRHQYFNLLVDSQIFYTDNANYAPTDQKIGSSVYVNTVQAAFIPKSISLENGNLSSSLGYASQWYNYESEQMDGQSFNAQTVFGGAKYAFDKWVMSFDLSYTWLLTQPHYDLTYRELLPSFTIQRFVPITDTVIVTLSDQVDYHFSYEPPTYIGPIQTASTEINNRLDNIIGLTITWQMAQNLYLQPAYRFVYTHYRYNTLETSGRDDYLNYVGISMAYYFSQYCSIRGFFNYNAKCSNDPYAWAYHETDGGAGISVNIIF